MVLDIQNTTPTMEETKISELKEKISDFASTDAKLEDPIYLLLWLKSCAFNVDKTEAKIRGARKWREENEVDKLATTDYCPQLSEEIPIRYDGVTNDGFKVVTVLLGAADFPNIAKKHGNKKYFSHWRQIVAKMEVDCLEVNKKQQGKEPLTADSAQSSTIVIDAKNCSWRQLRNRQLVSEFIQWTRDSMRYFPSNNTIIFLNVSSISKMILNIFIPLVASPSTKIEVYGAEQDSWKTLLFSRFGQDQLLTVEEFCSSRKTREFEFTEE